MSALDVALQLERSQILPVAVMASGVALPALTVLFLQLQVVLHVVHEPADRVQTHTHTHRDAEANTRKLIIKQKRENDDRSLEQKHNKGLNCFISEYKCQHL